MVIFNNLLMETLNYILETNDFFINPMECVITEEFRGESKLIGRILREKVPCKQIYVIMKQYKWGFPELLDSTSNIQTASNKLLMYSLKWVKELIKKEGKLDLFLKYKIIDHTHIREKERYFKKFKI